MAPSPHLALQEVLVEVEVRVPNCQQPDRLHPHSSLTLTLHLNLLEAAETKQLALLEVAGSGGGGARGGRV